jgi:hypothetical protein
MRNVMHRRNVALSEQARAVWWSHLRMLGARVGEKREEPPEWSRY